MRKTVTEHQATAANREILVKIFESGISQSKRVGVEMEHELVRQGSGAPVPYAGEQGVEVLLESLKEAYKEVTPVHEDGTGGILGLARTGHTITLEPAAQFEISMRPYHRLADVAAEYRDFRRTLDPALERIGAETPFLGYHPTAKVDDLALIPKFRYRSMDRYFMGISHWGRSMMRGTASLQVSVDYKHEDDAIAKMRAASAIGPVLYLMLDNAPVFEGAWRPHHIMRAACWQGCDPDRCNVVPGLFDEGFDFEAYADYVLATPPILVPDPSQEVGWRYTGSQPVNDIYAERAMTPAEATHVLSMLFPDVRLKEYLEIRHADAVKPELALAYVALIKGLLYSDTAIRDLSQMAESFDDATVPAMKQAISERGYEAVLLAGTPYEQTAAELADDLVARAERSLGDDEYELIFPLKELVADRRTPAQSWENPYEQGPHGAHL
ncbi:MAG: glutamate-cysteine ligase family protein [Coriobacteriales bacterium]|nr:glutamate-cysteine ligase family protein [Coriobacteriales bacterium]